MNMRINWCRRVQGCEVSPLMQPHLVRAISVVNVDILPENA